MSNIKEYFSALLLLLTVPFNSKPIPGGGIIEQNFFCNTKQMIDHLEMYFIREIIWLHGIGLISYRK